LIEVGSICPCDLNPLSSRQIMVESNRRRKAAERSAEAKWNALYESSMVRSMRAELAWMEAEEDARVCRSMLVVSRDVPV
jgi:hypothetical protein